MAQRIILHLDMNSFFASVEQQANPAWRGRPVGVCAYLNDQSTIIAASVEAKRIGIKTGTRVREAKEIYPGVILTANDPPKYRQVSQQLYQMACGYTDRVEHYSIDEVFLDLTGWRKDWDEAVALAKTLKQRIRQEIGDWLRCSIGIGPTKFFAKIGSDLTKPDGLNVVTKENVDSVYAQMALTDAWGIAHGLERRFNALGVFTLLDLKRYPVENLRRALGLAGEQWHLRTNGLDQELVVNTALAEAEPNKSYGHQYTLTKTTSDQVALRTILAKLCEMVGRRLRADNVLARRVAAAVRLEQHGAPGIWWGGQRHLAEPISRTVDLYQTACSLLERHWTVGQTRFLNVTALDIAPPSGQQRLFGSRHQERADQLQAALDQVNDTYGEFTVRPGAIPDPGSYVPDRVAFRGH